MATYEEFATWLQQAMEQRGLDQAQIARLSGITTAQISRVLTGDRRAGPTFCRKIARALHLPPEEVFRKAGLLPPERSKPDGAEELLHLYTELGKADQTRLLAIARALRELAE